MRKTKFDMRHYENVHIPLWLLKDTCWMMQWKSLGIAMIVPTLTVAVYIAYRSWGVRQFWLNAAISFWIAANSYWMCVEFFEREDLKYYASIPFALGFVCTIYFYLPKKPNPDA